MNTHLRPHVGSGYVLTGEFGNVFFFQLRADGVHIDQCGIVQRLFDGALARSAEFGETHSIGRQNAGKRMHMYGFHAQHIGNHAGMLPARAAKGGQRIFGHVIAALNGNLLDGVGHVFDRDAQEPVGGFFRRPAIADVAGKVAEGGFDRVGVQRQILVRAEDGGEEFRAEFAHHHIGVGDGEGTAAPVTARSRIGPG